MKLSAQQWLSVALAVLALGSVAVVLVTRNVPSTSERLDRSRNLVGVWHADEIRSITLRSRERSFRLERAAPSNGPAPEARDFWLFAPDREEAAGAAVDRLISGLELSAPVRRLDGGDLEALGLAKPAATLVVAMGETKLELWLGKDAPSPAGAAYAAVVRDGRPPELAVVPKDVAALFRMTADDFRERALAGIAKSDVRELVFTRSSGALRLVRSGAGFRIDGGARAGRDALEPVFAALSRLEARRFLPLAEAERARGGPARLVVHVTPNDAREKPVLVELGGDCPGFSDETIAVSRSPRARGACVERAVAGALELDRAVLVDREPFQARADEVETLRIERGSKRLVLARRGSSFLLREPSESEVALEAGNERLAAVLRAPAELAPNPDPRSLGLDSPEGKVVVTRLADDDKAVEETLLLGRTRADGSLAARRADDGAVLVLGRDAARAFAVDATLLKPLRVVDFALSSLAELELSAPEHQLLRRAASGFELVVPAGFAHDGALATDAVLAFGSLTALRFVADGDDGSFGFEAPVLTAIARFDADGGARSSRLVIGRSTPGGNFAKLDGDPSVFVVERSVTERLGTLLVDRSPFVADPKTLARVTIGANGVTRTLERRHDELVPSASSGIDRAVAGRLMEALESLRAERAVHTGPPRPGEGFSKPALEVRFEPSPGLGKARSFRVGASATPSSARAESGFQAAHYVRADGVDATFLVADAKLKPLFDLF
jgi:hypothetical protein